MRHGALILSLLSTTGCVLSTTGCSGGDGVSPPRPVDAGASLDAAASDSAPAPDGGPPGEGGRTCARAPFAEIAGSSLMRERGDEASSATHAEVRWVLTSSEGCIDRYHPTGTISFMLVDSCRSRVEPISVPVQAQEGVLTIDRTQDPIVYEIRGATTWDATITCDDESDESPRTVGGPWALGRGTFDGDVLAGGFDTGDADASWWEYVNADVELPDDEPGCVEPAVDHLWGTASVSGGSEAAVTWTRVSTAGCADVFQPSGVATAPTKSAACSTITTTPPSVPIAPEHGELILGRDARPVRIRFHGATAWPGARICTQPDGTGYSEHGAMGGPWGGSIRARFDGTRFSGSTTFDGVDYAWSITRLPPPAAAASPAR